MLEKQRWLNARRVLSNFEEKIMFLVDRGRNENGRYGVQELAAEIVRRKQREERT